MGDNAIEVHGVSKRFKLYSERRDTLRERFVRGASKYQEFWALRDIDLEIPAGSTFALIGHNGSGKSTLLKLLAGVHRPTSGSIVAKGRMSALLELGAGFHPELTGRENIYLNGAILGLSNKQINSSIDEIIDFAGIGEFIDTPVKIYSSGMAVRLGFSVAVQVDPEILMVDEVIAVGDEEFQRKCMDRLYMLRRGGTTIVLVSHSMANVRQLCDHGVWLDHGRQQALGDVRAVIDAYLDAVNQREAADSVGGPNQVNVRNRVGSGEITVESIELRTAAGATTTFGTSGESLTFRIHYQCATDIDDVEVALGFVHESGTLVSQPSSASDGRTFAVSAGQGHFDFTVDRLSLQPGEFAISTGISAGGHTYDALSEEFTLPVRAAHGEIGAGLVTLSGQWSLPAASNVER